jgi:hypothetical protein
MHDDTGTFVAGSVSPSSSSPSVCRHSRPRHLSHCPLQIHPPSIDSSTAQLQVPPLPSTSHSCFQVFLALILQVPCFSVKQYKKIEKRGRNEEEGTLDFLLFLHVVLCLFFFFKKKKNRKEKKE